MQSQSLLTVKQFAEKHPAFPESSLRWMKFNPGGRFDHLQAAFVNIGRRVLVDESAFFELARNKAA